MIRFFLSRTLLWLANLPWADFLRVVQSVRVAAEIWPKHTSLDKGTRAEINQRRAEQVRRFIRQTFPAFDGWMVNGIMELAVAWFNRGHKK